MSRFLSQAIAILVSACFFSISFAGEQPTTFDCAYHTFSDSKGVHAAEKDFSMRFVVEAGAKSARMIGKHGTTRVKVIPSAEGVTFVEITDVGNVMTTTITSKGESVHSRNGILLGELIPSQYYGSCRQR